MLLLMPISSSDVVEDLKFEYKDLRLEDKYLWSENKEGPGLEVRGQGQGLANWSSRTTTLGYSKEWLT